jgi:hypothetical protein
MTVIPFSKIVPNHVTHCFVNTSLDLVDRSIAKRSQSGVWLTQLGVHGDLKACIMYHSTHIGVLNTLSAVRGASPFSCQSLPYPIFQSCLHKFVLVVANGLKRAPNVGLFPVLQSKHPTPLKYRMGTACNFYAPDLSTCLH